MNKKRLLILIILTIFIIGMVLSPASASHTFTAGKYKITITDKQYKKLKKAQKGSYYGVTKKTGKYKTYKSGKTKYKWKYIKVLSFKSVSNADWSDTTYYEPDTVYKYIDKGWHIYGYTDIEENGGHISKTYTKLKKKVKVSSSKIKKAPIKITVGADAMEGAYVTVYCDYFNNGYTSKTYEFKHIRL